MPDGPKTNEVNASDQINAYHKNYSWIKPIRYYFNLDTETFAEFIACFFRKHVDETFPICLPSWAQVFPSEEYARMRKEICTRKNWSRENSLVLFSMIHLEIMGHKKYKLLLHNEWLAQLGQAVVPGQPFSILDYGSGVSSFSELSLSYPETNCTLADVDGMEYLRYRHAQWGKRVKLQKLDVLPGGLFPRVRVQVDFKKITGPFDAVILADVLEHTLNPLALLLHLYRQTKPDGLLFINYPDYIEGAWHTPEANYLRRWCYRFLRRTCVQLGHYTWRKTNGLKAALAWILLFSLEPILYRKAKQFARQYFKSHGQEIVELLRSREMETNIAKLLESVDQVCQ